MRAAEDHGAGAVQAVHHGAPGGAQVRAEHQGRQEDGGLDDRRGVGRARGGHPRAPGAAQPRTHAAPSRHPGVRTAAGRGQGDPGAPAGVPRLQRRLRRRPDGCPPAALRGGTGGGADPDALLQQHPLSGPRRAAGDAHAGHDPRRLLPDVRPRSRRARRQAGAARRRQVAGQRAAPARVPHRAGGRALLRGGRGDAARRRRVPALRPRGRPPAHHRRADRLQRPHRAGAGGGAGRRVRRLQVHVRQPVDEEARHHAPRGRARAGLRRDHDLAGARRLQGPRLQVLHAGRHHDLQERRGDPSAQGRDHQEVRGHRGGDLRAVRHGPDHPGGAPRGGRGEVERRHRRGRRRDDREPRHAQPDLHDGQLRRARLVQADPPAGGDARADGQPEG